MNNNQQDATAAKQALDDLWEQGHNKGYNQGFEAGKEYACEHVKVETDLLVEMLKIAEEGLKEIYLATNDARSYESLVSIIGREAFDKWEAECYE